MRGEPGLGELDSGQVGTGRRDRPPRAPPIKLAGRTAGVAVSGRTDAGEPMAGGRAAWRSAKKTSQDSLQIPADDDPHDRDDLTVNPIERPLVPSPGAIQGKGEALQSFDLAPPWEGGMSEGPHRLDERAPVLLGEGVEVCASVGREVDGELRHRTG